MFYFLLTSWTWRLFGIEYSRSAMVNVVLPALCVAKKFLNQFDLFTTTDTDINTVDHKLPVNDF